MSKAVTPATAVTTATTEINANSAGSNTMRLWFRKQVREVSVRGTRTALEWLREEQQATGTKEGCNEGDCGACTVVVASLDEQAPQGVALHTMNACMLFMPALDGKALFTVEDLQPLAAKVRQESIAKSFATSSAPSPWSTPAVVSGPAGAGACAKAGHGASAHVLHPVQQALLDCHASQCGFCTPGIAMTLWHSYETHQQQGTRPVRQELADALAGNLCRCTGYRPILEAGGRMFDEPVVQLDRAALAEQLKALQATPVHHLRSPEPQGERQVWLPRSADELAALKLAHPQARLVAGATDVALWVNKRFRDLGDVIHVKQVPELCLIREDAWGLHLGAAVSLDEAWAALVDKVPALRELWLRFASPPVRHAGTLGGNVANGSPIGDGPPMLLALDAELSLRQGDVTRRLPLSAFYLDYMKNALAEGEWLAEMHVPRTAWARQTRAYKVSKRFDSDISAVCAGLSLALQGDRVSEVRLAFGGMAGTVKRAEQAETALLGQAWGEAALRNAQQALTQDFQPLSDMRASADYRMQVAQNLLRRFWLETRPESPLSASDTSIWAAQVQTGSTGSTQREVGA